MAQSKDFHIIAETGIHARPATLLVQAASKFASDVTLSYQGKDVNSVSYTHLTLPTTERV